MTACSELTLLVWLTSCQLAISVEIDFDYSYDTSGMFATDERRLALERAGAMYSRLRDSLAPINPQSERDTVTFRLLSPERLPILLVDPQIPANTIRVYVSAAELGPSTLGLAWPSSWVASGSVEFLDTVNRRGQVGQTVGSLATDYQVAVGSITFDSSTKWSFDPTASRASGPDFLSVAIHELGHVLGYGSADSWRANVDWTADTFHGPAATAWYGAPVPLSTDDVHWATGKIRTGDGTENLPLMNPFYIKGRSPMLTDLDIAGLTDIGWNWAEDGDSDLDGDVDTTDFLSLQHNWTGSLEQFSGHQTFLLGDSDFDGDTDSSDLLRLIAGWSANRQLSGDGTKVRTESSPSTLPEPEDNVWLLYIGGTIYALQRSALLRNRVRRPGANQGWSSPKGL